MTEPKGRSVADCLDHIIEAISFIEDYTQDLNKEEFVQWDLTRHNGTSCGARF